MTSGNKKHESGKRSLSPGFMPGRPGAWGQRLEKSNIKDAKKLLKRIWLELLSAHKNTLGIVIALSITSSVLGLVGPYLIGRAINSFVNAEPFEYSIMILAGLLLAYVFGSLLMWIQGYMMAGLAQKVVANFRHTIFVKIQTLPIKFFDSRPHGELMSRLTNDIDNISNVLGGTVIQVFSSAITVVGALSMMIWLNPILTLVGLIFIPVGFVATAKIAVYTRKYFMKSHQDLGALNAYIEEIITGQRVVKAYAQESECQVKFNEFNSELKKSNLKAQIFTGLIPPIMNLLNNMSIVMIAATGGYLIVAGMANVGMIASFLNYSRQFTWPLNELANQFNMIQSALAGAERVYEIMDMTPEGIDENKLSSFNGVTDSITFDEVSFGYVDNINVLKNISIDVRAGQTIALVGPTGAGKTTIANLLTRFYDVNDGSINLDGKDIRTFQRTSLRDMVSLVLQDTFLFTDSVKANIRYGKPDATEQEIENAARLANADSFIRRLPESYDTMIAEGGDNLSQGQRQLIAIARAVLANPSVLILDEATSNVDTRTELKIRNAMHELLKGRTAFVIAHRLSTVRNADQILFINDGEIIEKGTHEDLIKASGAYSKLYYSQFSMIPAKAVKAV